MTWLVRSVLSDLYPSTDALPGVSETGLAEFIPQFRREAPFTMWVGVMLGTVIYCVAPLFTVGVPVFSFMLRGKLRDLHAQRIATTPLHLVRQLMFLLKMVAGLCWGQHPVVREKMGLSEYPKDPGTWRTT